jgi:hypothetical protein
MGFGIRRSKLVQLSRHIPVVRGVVSPLYRSWLKQKHELNWNYFLNPRSARKFRRQEPVLNEAQQRIVSSLNSSGIALCHFNDLFEEKRRYDQICRSGEEFIDSAEKFLSKVRSGDEYHGAIALGHNLDRIGRYVCDGERPKSDDYLIKLFPEQPCLCVRNEWLQFALDRRVLDVVNEYFQLWAKLTYVDLWYAVSTGGNPSRIGSQRWHRDPEDKKMLKIYLYLADASEDSGPLQYIVGSCRGGRYENAWPRRRPDGIPYPPQECVQKEIPASNWITCVGSKGTIVLCDTSGLHRGGINTTGRRVAATWTFVTPASLYPRRFDVEYSREKVEMSEAAKFALA